MYENREMGPNFYRVLEFSRGDSFEKLKKNFRRISLEWHPDKNKSPEAVHTFRKVKHAYETLVKPDLRRIYNLYGEEGIRKSVQSVIDHKELLINMIVYYVSSAIFAVLMTISEPSGSAMSMCIFGLFCLLLLEMVLILEEVSLPHWFLPYNTSYEIVKLSQRLFPAYMHGVRCIFGAFYVDEKAMRVDSLTNVISSMKITTLKLNSIVQNFTSNQEIIKTSGEDYRVDNREGVVEKAMMEQLMYSSPNSTVSRKFMNEQVELIADPIRLHSYERPSNVLEFIKHIVIYLLLVQFLQWR